MKIKNLGLAFPLVFALASCGGGGDVAGDVATYAVLPSSVAWTATACPGTVSGRVSIHTINGGKPPFRVRTQAVQNELGLVDSSNGFTTPSPTMFNEQGDLVLTGKDPKFAVRSTMSCDDKGSVVVLDYHSKVATVEFSVVPPDSQ